MKNILLPATVFLVIFGMVMSRAMARRYGLDGSPLAQIVMFAIWLFLTWVPWYFIQDWMLSK